MKAKDIIAHLKTQLEQGLAPFEQEVVVRLAGRDYTVRSIDASTAALVLEGGAEVIQDDTLPGTSGAVPHAELSQETAAPVDTHDAFAEAVPEVTTEVATPRANTRAETGRQSSTSS
jgi:hypothetical protein